MFVIYDLINANKVWNEFVVSSTELDKEQWDYHCYYSINNLVLSGIYSLPYNEPLQWFKFFLYSRSEHMCSSPYYRRVARSKKNSLVRC